MREQSVGAERESERALDRDKSGRKTKMEIEKVRIGNRRNEE